MTRKRRAWRRFFVRFAYYASAWVTVLVLSWIALQRGRSLGGTAEWAGFLHPVLFGMTAWPVFRQFVRGERWFTIPNAVLGLFYVTIGLGSLYFVFRYDALGYAALRRPGEVRDALLVAIVGVAAYRLASMVPWSRRLSAILPTLPETPRWSWKVRAGAFATVGLAVVLKSVLAATGSLGYATASGMGASGLRSLVSFLSMGGLFVLSGLYYYWFAGANLSLIDRVFILAVTVVLSVFALLSGMKEELLLVFVAVFVPYSWTRRQDVTRGNRLKALVIGGSGAVLVLMLFAVNPLYRAALKQVSETQNRLQQGPRAAALALGRLSSTGRGRTVLETGAETLWARFSTFPNLIPAVDQVPAEQGYRAFRRYPLLPAMMFVPRLIWPDKPEATGGVAYQRRFISNEAVYSNTATVFGWSYWEYGAVGVLVLLFLLGSLARLTESYLTELPQPGLAAVILYCGMFVALVDVESDPFWLVSGVPKILVIALLMYGIFIAPSLARRQEAAGGDNAHRGLGGR